MILQPSASLDAMSGGSVRTNVEVTSPQGLHLRPLTALSQVASAFTANVRVSKEEGQWVDGKSAWEMMNMISAPGTVLTIEAEGPDAPAALKGMLAELQRWAEIDDAPDAAVQG